MMATFRPLRWTGPSTLPGERRSRWTFKAPWQSTLDLLERELQHLDARDVVIEADFTEQDIRLDGMPRANARQPVHPGVRIAFSSKHGPLVYATDSCEFWQHNVRSIALGLEALRAVDRYGVAKRGEQYTGWKALPAGATPMRAGMTVEDAARFIAQGSVESPLSGRPVFTASDVLSKPTVLRAAYTLAARRLHPDRGGSSEAFQRLQDAKRILDQHIGR